MEPLGMATVTLSGTLQQKFEAMAEAGFSRVEFFEDDLAGLAGGPGEAGRMARVLDLEIVMFQPFREFEAMPEPQRSEGFCRAERAFDVMGELGAKRLLVCSNVSPLTAPDLDRAAADIHELAERAARRGLVIGYEALAWGSHVFDHRSAWEVVRRANHPGVGIVLDSFHTLARQIPIDSLRSIPGDKIAFVQIADAPRLNIDYLKWSRHSRSLPGEGDFALASFVEAVLATGYSGSFSLEIFSDVLKTKHPNVVATDGYQALAALLSTARQARDTTWRSVA
ncbi:putative 4-hydroxyphenylpyruvate dioxygenase protein [Fulvimarina pelagi HTCC2506]|uniref:Putative 4-hydroxyphenylpyruvate dioxygenase protein n=2 Tax=Fulvimarina pelagi TaxID=217511 RepID=Q0G365_9HYPH|nr:putative 4-hydroxyphenylpyruvate dioxygenase protein [Fulvimarina pelagi HTCC2506]